MSSIISYSVGVYIVPNPKPIPRITYRGLLRHTHSMYVHLHLVSLHFLRCSSQTGQRSKDTVLDFATHLKKMCDAHIFTSATVHHLFISGTDTVKSNVRSRGAAIHRLGSPLQGGGSLGTSSEGVSRGL